MFGQRVEVGEEEQALGLILHPHPAQDRAQQIAKMEAARRLDSGNDPDCGLVGHAFRATPEQDFHIVEHEGARQEAGGGVDGDTRADEHHQRDIALPDAAAEPGVEQLIEAEDRNAHQQRCKREPGNPALQLRIGHEMAALAQRPVEHPDVDGRGQGGRERRPDMAEAPLREHRDQDDIADQVHADRLDGKADGRPVSCRA